MKTWLIRGAKVVDPSQNLEDTRDILIKDGKIQEIGTNIISENAEIIEANGLIAAPGLVDMHVHLRDPGQTHKETVQTGCQSAAAAGVTSLDVYKRQRQGRPDGVEYPSHGKDGVT